MYFNPIQLMDIFYGIEQYFDDSFINKIKSNFKDKHSYDINNYFWDDKNEEVQYQSVIDILENIDGQTEAVGEEIVSVKEKFSQYLLKEINNKFQTFKKKYISLILKDNIEVKAYINNYDEYIIILFQKIKLLNQSDEVKDILIDLMKRLKKINESISQKIRIPENKEHVKVFTKISKSLNEAKCFKCTTNFLKTKELIIPYLINKGIISENDIPHFNQLFTNTGFNETKNLKFKWNYKSKDNNKNDNSSIISLIFLLLDLNLVHKNWKGDSELSKIISQYFYDKKDNPIKISQSSITKAKVNNVKFEDLKKLLESCLSNSQ